MTECSRCGKKKAVIGLDYMSEQLCGNCFSQLYEKRVRKTIRKHDMVDPDEKIALAVSGGKDSLSMANVMTKLYDNVIILTIDEGISGYRDKAIEKVEKFSEEKNIPLEEYSFEEEYGLTIDEVAEKNRSKTCSYCGVFKRRLLNKSARELGCDKLVTGHNLDDETQTILMNITRGETERLARMGAITGFRDHSKFVPRIKPIRRCSEKENTVYALVNDIDFESKGCPYAKSDYRLFSRNYLNRVEEKKPGTKFSVLSGYDEMLSALREYYKEKKGSINSCSECGEPTSRDVCKACKMKKEIQKM